MPVETFVDNPEPTDPRSSIWRYIEFWKLQDLVQTGQLYLRRSDKLEDEHEGVPPLAASVLPALSRPTQANDTAITHFVL